MANALGDPRSRAAGLAGATSPAAAASPAPSAGRPGKRFARLRRGLLLALATISIAALCAAPWLKPELVWSGWLGIAAALVLVTRVGPLVGLACTFAWATIALAVAFHWAPEVLAYTIQSSYGWGVAVFLPLVLWEATRTTLPFWLAARIVRRPAAAWIPAACIAVILETALPTVFPWRMGYMQLAWPVTIQGADLLGTEWATVSEFAHAAVILVLIQAVNQAARTRTLLPAAGMVLCSSACWLCCANLLYGVGAMRYWSARAAQSPALRVALVQEDPTFQGSDEKMLRLTRSISDRADLVCWPESSGGSYEFSLDRLNDPARIMPLSRDPMRGLRPWPDPTCPLLLGTKTYRGERNHPDELYQSAILLDTQERIVGRYHKRYLMPFGEYVPGEGWVPGIDKLFSISDIVLPGREATVLDAGNGCRLGAMLCYEDMQPEAARSLAGNSANLLVSLINGSAFTNPLTLTQHRLLAQLRAVECRRYLLRSAATGDTCVISPLGEVVARLPLKSPGVLTWTVHLLDDQTWACRRGDILAWLSALGLMALVLYSRPWRRDAGRGESAAALPASPRPGPL